MASTGEYIGIVNPDVVLKKGSIDCIVCKANKTSENEIIAPQLLNPDGSVQYSVRKFVTLRMMFQRWMS